METLNHGIVKMNKDNQNGLRVKKRIPIIVRLTTFRHYPTYLIQRYRFIKRFMKHPRRSLLGSFIFKASKSFFLKDGNKLEAKSFGDLISKLKYMEKDKVFEFNCADKSKIFKIYHIAYGHEYVFSGKRYNWIQFFNRDVLDIGASIGDSAIYFLCKGAKRVIAVEPDVEIFQFCEENVKMNNCEDVIELVNAGINISPSEQIFNCAPESARLGNGIPIKSSRYVVPRVDKSLEELIEEFKVNKGAVLKISCEGCETAIFDHIRDGTLNLFDYIHVEYFYGSMDIARKLKECGFSVKCTLPRISVDKITGTRRILGEIKAWRL